jgi:hypothetical protein
MLVTAHWPTANCHRDLARNKESAEPGDTGGCSGHLPLDVNGKRSPWMRWGRHNTAERIVAGSTGTADMAVPNSNNRQASTRRTASRPKLALHTALHDLSRVSPPLGGRTLVIRGGAVNVIFHVQKRVATGDTQLPGVIPARFAGHVRDVASHCIFRAKYGTRACTNPP